ncbi:MAG: 50S ribosomal protein L25 [Bacilli bacterium]|nr:50S ribosomal protein L25 [Bacilli bacterium]MBN2696897.1 50S ribosomal protein L25 [Bacilli bacterium]
MKLEKRTEPLRIVRKMGKVPGVLFGKAIEPVSIQVDEKELQETLRIHGKTQTFKVKLDNKTHIVYIKDVQRAILNRKHFLNVELLHVEKSDTITAKIPLHLNGRETIEHHGRIVQLVADAIEVEYAVGKGQSHIDVDVSHLQVGDTIKVKDIKLPEELKSVDDPEKVLIHFGERRVHAADVEKEEEAEAVEAEAEQSDSESE